MSPETRARSMSPFVIWSGRSLRGSLMDGSCPLQMPRSVSRDRVPTTRTDVPETSRLLATGSPTYGRRTRSRVEGANLDFTGACEVRVCVWSCASQGPGTCKTVQGGSQKDVSCPQQRKTEETSTRDDWHGPTSRVSFLHP